MMSFLPPHDGAAAVAAPLAPHGVNTQAAKLTFPGKVPVATRDAVLSYVAPPGFRIHPLTANARSGAVYYGVKLDVLQDDGTVHPSDKRFACLASVANAGTATPAKLLTCAVGGPVAVANAEATIPSQHADGALAVKVSGRWARCNEGVAPAM